MCDLPHSQRIGWDYLQCGACNTLLMSARRAEAALERNDVDGAITAVAEDIRPIDDVRSTAAYRRAVTQNVLRELLNAFARS